MIERAATDPDFRARLLAEPHETLSSFLGVDLPRDLNIRVEEEQPGEVVLILPLAEGSHGLSDGDLATTSGGWGGATPPTRNPALCRQG